MIGFALSVVPHQSLVCGFYWQLRLSRSVEITEWKRLKEEKSEGLLIQVYFLTTGVMGRSVGSMMVGQVVLPLLLFITFISALSPPQPRVFLPFQVEMAWSASWSIFNFV
ncbi:hypothetical protein AOLI_G00309560 [Acnodon oligacanthus]